MILFVVMCLIFMVTVGSGTGFAVSEAIPKLSPDWQMVANWSVAVMVAASSLLPASILYLTKNDHGFPRKKAMKFVFVPSALVAFAAIVGWHSGGVDQMLLFASYALLSIPLTCTVLAWGTLAWLNLGLAEKKST